MTMQSSQDKPRIGFIGLGHMGELMVQRLVQAGYQIAVYDRTKEKAQDVARQYGARAVERPRDLAEQGDVVMSIVADDTAVESIMYGPDGVLAGARPQTTIIDLSTVSPEMSRRVFMSAKDQKMHMLDAAVSGSTPQVREGSLVIFVGGEEEIYQRYRPVLEPLGKSIFYMGPSGSGTTMKMVVNTLLGLGLQAIAEATSLGEKAGLNKHLMIDVLGQTAAVAPTHKAKLVNLKNEEYPTAFALSLMRKDFSLIMRLAARLSVAMPATAAAAQMYAAALAQGYHNDDYSVMMRFMEILNGLPADHKEH